MKSDRPALSNLRLRAGIELTVAMSKALSTKRRSRRPASLVFRLPFTAYILLLAACWLLPTVRCRGQSQIENPPAQTDEAQNALAADWAPELLDAILTSPNEEAHDALYRAAFAAGPAIVPELEAALKDDRTAEFAAQSLAFMGGAQALEILAKLVSDKRDLDLRRFYYGALGEFDAPQATEVLVDAIRRADQEPDRTVTEAAVLALTVRSEASLVAPLRQVEAGIKDFVIHDDLDNAIEVIQIRARYLAAPDGKSSGASIERAVRAYFIPALEPPARPAAGGAATAASSVPNPTPRAVGARTLASSRPPASRAKGLAAPATPAPAGVKVEIRNLTFSPDKQRALARVVFEDPEAYANYDIVLEKRLGNWTIASVWLGAEAEKAPAKADARPRDRSGARRDD